MFVSRAELVIGVKDLFVLIVDCAAASWEQNCMSQTFDGRTLFAPLNEFGSLPSTAHFCFLAALAISSLFTLRYFPGAIQ